MSAEGLEAQNQPHEQSFALIPSGIDFTTFKTHLVIAAIVAIVITIASGYLHLSSIALLLVAGCAVLVSQITAAITGLFGNRLSGVSSVWAGLLFVLYTMKVLIGSPDQQNNNQLLAEILYLAAIHQYFKFRTWRERPYFAFSLGASFLALLCSATAWTIPLVISSAEFLILPGYSGLSKIAQTRLKTQRLMSMLLYWLVLLLAISAGMLIPQAVPLATANLDVKQSLAWIFTALSPTAIINPGAALPWQITLSLAAGGLILILLILRYCLRATSFKVQLFLAIWFIASLLTVSSTPDSNPPSLFNAAAPLVIFLTFAALPENVPVSKKLANWLGWFGSICLTALACSWILAGS